jgi:hypothetical protein
MYTAASATVKNARSLGVIEGSVWGHGVAKLRGKNPPDMPEGTHWFLENGPGRELLAAGATVRVVQGLGEGTGPSHEAPNRLRREADDRPGQHMHRL